MEAIKNTVDDLMREWEERKNKSLRDSPEALLKKILTKRELQHIKFNYFRKGILGINVDSSGWMYCLSLKKDVLLAGLQKDLPELKEIYFRLGKADG